jgi:hypothetical protein
VISLEPFSVIETEFGKKSGLREETHRVGNGGDNTALIYSSYRSKGKQQNRVHGLAVLYFSYLVASQSASIRSFPGLEQNRQSELQTGMRITRQFPSNLNIF